MGTRSFANRSLLIKKQNWNRFYGRRDRDAFRAIQDVRFGSRLQATLILRATRSK
jgi:hypothetical protein